MIETLATSKEMLFEFAPLIDGPIQLKRFDVRGLSVVLPRLRAACGWK